MTASLPPGPRIPRALQIPAMVGWPFSLLGACQRRYGNIFTLRLGGGTVVFVTDPEHLREMFACDPAVLHAGEANAWAVDPMTGHFSLLTLDGAIHSRHRRLLLSAVSTRSARAYEGLMREVTAEEVATWRDGEPFSLQAAAQRITLEIIFRIAFGIDACARADQLRALMVRMLDIAAHRLFPAVIGIPTLRKAVSNRDWMMLGRLRSQIDELLLEEIALRRADPLLEERKDVLSVLIRADDPEAGALSDREVLDELMTLLLAGHESTATALSWAFHWLLRDEACVERLDRELEAGEDGYLEAIIQESLRLVSVAPFVGRVVQSEIDFAGYRLPAGTWIVACTYVMQRRNELYPDPERFRPERFLATNADPCAWAPFGGGARRCVGAGMAMLELKLVIAEILSRVKLEAVGSRPEAVRQRLITLEPGRGSLARVVGRYEPSRELLVGDADETGSLGPADGRLAAARCPVSATS